MGRDDNPLYEPEASELEALRWARDHRLPALAEVQEFPRRYG